MDSVATLVAKLISDTSDFHRGMADAQRDLQSVGDSVSNTGRNMQRMGGQMTRRVSVPIVGAIGASAAAMIDFEDGMTQSMAIMGDVSDGTKRQMEQAARDVAMTTTSSHREAADSYFFLASAGLDAEQSIAALPQVANFAQAGMFDMATATDLATDAQSALGLTVPDAAKNLENLTRVTDVTVKANELANASVEQFSQGLMRAGGQMRSAGVDVESGTAVLAALADQGIKGARAGTQLRNVYRRLPNVATKNADAFEELNVAIYDSDGALRSMPDILDDVNAATGDMSAEARAAAFDQLGLRGHLGDTFLALMDQGDAIRGYESELRGAGGAVDDVASNQLESLKSQLELAKSAFVDFGIQIGQDLAPIINDLVGWLQKAAEWFGNLSESQRRTILIAAGVAAAMGPVLVVVGAVFRAVGSIIKGFGMLVKVFGGAIKVAGFLAKAIGFVGKAIFLMGKALLANPILLIIAAIAVAAYLIYKNWDAIVAWFQDLWAKVKEIFSAFLEWVSGIWDGVTEWVSSAWSGVTEWFSQMWDAIKQLFSDAVAAVVTTVVGWKDSTVAAAVALKDAVVGWVTDMWDRIQTAFTTAVDAVVGLVTGLKDRVVDIVQQLVTSYILFIVGLRDRVIETVTNLKDRFVELVTNLRDRVVEFVTNLRDRAVELVTNLKDRAVELVTNLKDRAVELFTNLKDRAVELFTNLKDRAVELVTNLKDRAVELFTNLKDRAVALVTTARDTVVNLVTNLRDRFVNLVTNLRDRAVNIVTNLKDRAVTLVTTLKDRVVALFRSARDWVVDAANRMKDKVVGAVQDLKDGAIEKFRSLVTWISGLPGRILGALGDLGTLLLAQGRAVLDGLWDGMKEVWDNMTGWIGGIADTIASIKGPMSKDKKLLVEQGAAIMGGLEKGLRSGWRSNEQLLGGMAGQMQDMLSTSVPMSADMGTSMANRKAQQQLAMLPDAAGSGMEDGGDVNFNFAEGAIVVQGGDRPTEENLARQLRNVGYRMVGR